MLFSIIMCTYNSARTLKYAVDSVIDQTYQDWELLVLDNGWLDILWASHALAYFQDRVFHLIRTSIPKYRKYDRKEKLTELEEIMRNIYYNSVMHYVKIEFLKKHRIDFYDPFYGDNQGMTEALCQAKTMVVMDRVEYVLTVNTSQTSAKTGWFLQNN